MREEKQKSPKEKINLAPFYNELGVISDDFNKRLATLLGEYEDCIGPISINECACNLEQYKEKGSFIIINFNIAKLT